MITTLKAQEINDDKAHLIIDVRTRDEFMQEHIPGSRNIPMEHLPDAVDALKALPQVIVSCRSGARAAQACQQLENLGVPQLTLLEGGIMAWKAAGRPTLRTSHQLSVMQQVQIIVGLMVLTGTFFRPFWLLAVIAGAGMLIAGLTNTCLMAVLLGKLPWNRVNTTSCHIHAK